jgi:hypothetical protein
VQKFFSVKAIAYCECVFVASGMGSRYNDLLRAGRSGNRIPVGARFFAPVHNSPTVHPDCYKLVPGHSLG